MHLTTTYAPLSRILGLFAMFALSWTLFTGCSLELPEEELTEPIAVCETSSECINGETCEAGFCVVTGDSNALEYIAIQLTPNGNSELIRNQYVDVEWSQGTPMPDLVLTRPIQVRGLTRTPEGDLVRAQVIFNRTSPQIVGTNTLSFEANAATTDTEIDFVAALPRGVYDLFVFPQDERFPPQTIRGLTIQADTELSIPFAPLDAYHKVSGRIVFTDALSQEVVAVRNATVQAINDTEDVISTSAITAEDGTFEISLLPNVESLQLVVDATPYHQPFPRVLTRSFPAETEDVRLGDIFLGELHPLGRSVVGQLTSEVDGSPISGAGLTFQGDLGAGVSTQTVWTDAEGKYELRLLPGSYTILVEPPTGQNHTVALLAPDPLPPPGESVPDSLRNLVIGTKIPVAGQLRAPITRQVIPGAKVTFEPQLFAALEGVDNAEKRAPRASLPSQTVLTDATGTFSASLNAGEYSVLVDPPASSGYGQYVYRGVVIDSNGSSLELVSASRTNVAYGRVIDTDGRPVSNVQIDVFRSVQEGDERARRIGRGTTDINGEYRVLLPNIRTLSAAAQRESFEE